MIFFSGKSKAQKRSPSVTGWFLRALEDVHEVDSHNLKNTDQFSRQQTIFPPIAIPSHWFLVPEAKHRALSARHCRTTYLKNLFLLLNSIPQKPVTQMSQIVDYGRFPQQRHYPENNQLKPITTLFPSKSFKALNLQKFHFHFNKKLFLNGKKRKPGKSSLRIIQ